MGILPVLWNGPVPAMFVPLVARQRTKPTEPAVDWYRLVNSGTGELTVYLEGIVGGGWFDDGVTASGLRDELEGFTGHTINARINSPGGDVFEGYAVANTLRAHSAAVHIHVDGIAASIASVIAMSGDTVTMAPQSMMMIHEASGMAWGNSGDMRQLADLLDKISDQIADAYAAKAGGEPADWRDLMRAESWYTGPEAVAAGLADSVASVERAADEPEPQSAQALAASVPERLYRFRSRLDAPAPLPLPVRPAALPEPPPTPVAVNTKEILRMINDAMGGVS